MSGIHHGIRASLSRPFAPAGAHGYIDFSGNGRVGGTFYWMLPWYVTQIQVVAIGAGSAGSAGGFDGGDNGSGGRHGNHAIATYNIPSPVQLTIVLGDGGLGAPNQYGAAGGNTTVTIPGIATVTATGGATHTSDSPGNGYGAWYWDVEANGFSTSRSAGNSYYTTLTGVTSAGASLKALDPYGTYLAGGPGIHGGAGGGGGGFRDGVSFVDSLRGSRAGGDGGAGFVRIYY